MTTLVAPLRVSLIYPTQVRDDNGNFICDAATPELAALLIDIVNGREDIKQAVCEGLRYMICKCGHPHCKRCKATKRMEAAIAAG